MRSSFPCAIGTKVWFACNGNVQADQVEGFKGANAHFVLMKSEDMIPMWAFMKYACYTLEEANKRAEMQRGATEWSS